MGLDHIIENDTYISHRGHFLNEAHIRIAEIIKDYEPTLELVWIPTEMRTPEDRGKEFAVVHSPHDAPQYIVFHCSADEVDHRLLARLFTGDTTKHDVIGWLDAIEESKRIIKLKAEADAAEERQAFVQSVIKSPKSRYKHNGVVYE